MKFVRNSSLVLFGILGIAGIQVVGFGQKPLESPQKLPDLSSGALDPSSTDQDLGNVPPWFGQPDQSMPATGPELPSSRVSPLKSPHNVGAAGDIIGFSHSDGSGSQRITLVNTSKSWMAVYHIDRSGRIRLASSRPIDADFTLQLNATAPLPDEIRRMDQRGNQPGNERR